MFQISSILILGLAVSVAQKVTITHDGCFKKYLNMEIICITPFEIKYGISEHQCLQHCKSNKKCKSVEFVFSSHQKCQLYDKKGVIGGGHPTQHCPPYKPPKLQPIVKSYGSYRRQNYYEKLACYAPYMPPRYHPTPGYTTKPTPVYTTKPPPVYTTKPPPVYTTKPPPVYTTKPPKTYGTRPPYPTTSPPYETFPTTGPQPPPPTTWANTEGPIQTEAPFLSPFTEDPFIGEPFTEEPNTDFIPIGREATGVVRGPPRQALPVGQFTQWGRWFSCNVNTGKQVRFRKCTSPNPNTCERDERDC